MRNIYKGLLPRSLALAVILAAALALLIFPATTSAAAATEISISAPSQPIESGEQVSINIIVAPATAIAGMQFDLHFDPSLFAVDSVAQGNLLAQNGASVLFNTGNIDNQLGVITGAFGAITTPGESVSNEGIFATITLTAREYTKACPLALSSIVVGDQQGHPVPASVINNGSLGAGANTPVFRWWVLSVIVGIALTLIAATTAGLLFRRHILLRAPAN